MGEARENAHDADNPSRSRTDDRHQPAPPGSVPTRAQGPHGGGKREVRWPVGGCSWAQWTSMHPTGGRAGQPNGREGGPAQRTVNERAGATQGRAAPALSRFAPGSPESILGLVAPESSAGFVSPAYAPATRETSTNRRSRPRWCSSRRRVRDGSGLAGRFPWRCRSSLPLHPNRWLRSPPGRRTTVLGGIVLVERLTFRSLEDLRLQPAVELDLGELALGVEVAVHHDVELHGEPNRTTRLIGEADPSVLLEVLLLLGRLSLGRVDPLLLEEKAGVLREEIAHGLRRRRSSSP